MSLIRLLPQLLDPSTRVIINSTSSPLSQQVYHQLLSLPKYQVNYVRQPSHISELPHVSLFIYFVDFGVSSIGKTLSFTSALYQYLEMANRSSARFVLVLPEDPSHLKQTSLTLVQQFAKSFQLRYQIVEVNPRIDPVQNAQKIIRSFRPGYIAPSTSSVVPQRPAYRINPPSLPHLSVKLPKIKIQFKLLRYWRLLLILFCLPIFIWVSQLLLIRFYFMCSLRHLDRSSLISASKCVSWTSNISRLYLYQTRIIPGLNSFSSSLGYPPQPAADALKHLSDTIKTLSKVAQYYSDTYSYFSHSSESGTLPENTDLAVALSSLSESLSYLQSDLKPLYISAPKLRSQLNEYAARLDIARRLLSKLQVINQDLPRLLSFSASSTYLILVQDSASPRPSGGKIISLVLVNVAEGRITHTQSFPVELADSQFRGQADPPPDFRKITGADSWLLRDVNWEPDFSNVARQAVWFINKELAVTPDVVIALNTHSLAQLLQTTGPVYIPEMKITVSSDNIAQLLAQNSSPISSTTSFSTYFTTAYEKHLRTLPPSRIIPVLFKLGQLLEQRELFITASSADILSLDKVGWSGKIPVSDCRSQLPCISTLFYPTLISSLPLTLTSHSFTSQISGDKFQHRYLVSYTSSNSPSAYSDYIYFRFFLPLGSVLGSLAINETDLKPNQYTSQVISDYLQIGVPVPRETSSGQVQIVFYQPQHIVSQFHYQLDIPHQPGLVSPPLELSLSYPKEWFATAYQAPLVATAGTLGYNTPSFSSTQLDIDFSLPQ